MRGATMFYSVPQLATCLTGISYDKFVPHSCMVLCKKCKKKSESINITLLYVDYVLQLLSIPYCQSTWVSVCMY